jgi:calcineurin-like phosphoesterase family protein
VLLGILSDLHLVQDTSRRGLWQNPYDFAGVQDRCERALALFAERGVDAVVLVGDLSEDAELPMLRRALRLAASDAPTFVVAGNHDGVGRLQRALQAEPGTARPLGVRGRALGGVRLAGLPITRRAQLRWGSVRRPAIAEWDRGLTVFASHFPVLARERALRQAGLRHPGDLVDREAVEAALRPRRRPTLVLSGHLHVRDSVATGSILQMVFGAMVEPPFEAALLEVERDGDSVTVERTAHELDKGRERRNPRMVPARERWRFTPKRGWRRALRAG